MRSCKQATLVYHHIYLISANTLDTWEENVAYLFLNVGLSLRISWIDLDESIIISNSRKKEYNNSQYYCVIKFFFYASLRCMKMLRKIYFYTDTLAMFLRKIMVRAPPAYFFLNILISLFIYKDLF